MGHVAGRARQPGSVIDLGLAGPAVDAGRAAGRAGPYRSALDPSLARWRRRLRRRWTTVAVGALVLWSVGGAARPAAPDWPDRAGTITLPDPATVSIDGDTVAVGRSGTAARAETPEGTYRLGSGPVARPFARHGIPALRDGSRWVMVDNRCDRGTVERPRLSVVDSASGAVLWQRTGWLLGGEAGFAVVTGAREDTCADPYQAPSAVIEVLATATGRPVWSTTVSDLAVATGRDATGRPVLIGAAIDGRYRRFDLATGRELVVASAVATQPAAPVPDSPPVPEPTVDPTADPTPVPGGNPGRALPIPLILGPDLVVTMYAVWGIGYRMIVLDPVTLAGRWQVSVDGYAQPTACARFICLTGQNGTTARSSGTGAIAWRSPYLLSGQVGPYHSAALPTDPRSVAEAATVVLDLRTGRPSAGLSGWKLGTSDGALGDPGAVPAALTVYRVGFGRTWFGRLEPGRGDTSPRVVASVPHEYRSCVLSSTFAACRDGSRLDAWRLPRREPA